MPDNPEPLAAGDIKALLVGAGLSVLASSKSVVSELLIAAREIYTETVRRLSPALSVGLGELGADVARKRTALLAKQFTQAEISNIGARIAEGIALGKTAPEIAATLDSVRGLDAARAARVVKYRTYLELKGIGDIDAKVERFREKELRDRRQNIALNERRAVLNATAAGAAQQAGATRKVWRTMQDDRVSDECMANESQGEIPINEDFVGGEAHPPQHPNCRCHLEFF